ncbi:PREDICTED: uncharacterized protein LOC108375024 [Rhagoletis zephyria]|uniref:uncharacterized protein LOC108375024 n=1 Tax=Rhagoletis zephyria TaxID=28612 RepID=UPI00081126D0|nr:PREDICTED: uncharacterized protein LOC108375024 [Rhagoletis zephyria]
MPSSGFHQLPIETERIELSEVECDVDTLKKLKLGMRSTLWSRPSSTTSQLQQPNNNNKQQQDTRCPPQQSQKGQPQTQSHPQQHSNNSRRDNNTLACTITTKIVE